MPGPTQPNATREQPAALLSPQSDRTIHYEEVLEAVNDPNYQRSKKHQIVEFPPKSDKWYIFRCRSHNLSFGMRESPRDLIRAVATHFDIARDHQFTGRDHNIAVKEIGELVLDCNAERAAHSNKLYREALKSGYKPDRFAKPKTPKKKGNGRSSVPIHPKSTQGPGAKTIGGPRSDANSVQHPKDGEIYQGFYKATTDSPGQWYLVAILPRGDWRPVGISAHLFTSPLAARIPACYEYFEGRGKGVKIHGWAAGYEEGGKKFGRRKYPVLFLDRHLYVPPSGTPFEIPDDPPVLSWLGTSNLRPRDFKHEDSEDTTELYAGIHVAQRFAARVEATRTFPHVYTDVDTDDSDDEPLATTRRHHGVSTLKARKVGEDSEVVKNMVSDAPRK